MNTLELDVLTRRLMEVVKDSGVKVNSISFGHPSDETAPPQGFPWVWVTHAPGAEISEQIVSRGSQGEMRDGKMVSRPAAKMVDVEMWTVVTTQRENTAIAQEHAMKLATELDQAIKDNYQLMNRDNINDLDIVGSDNQIRVRLPKGKEAGKPISAYNIVTKVRLILRHGLP